jgi:hypothetical protein
MNSGLPSLIDAIFGKNDLTTVSLEELYELINEFPSFNAGHFLLSKKLMLENHASFEKESMKTALYFHNAFWLQTLLNDVNNTEPAELFPRVWSNQKENQPAEKPEFETYAEDNSNVEVINPPINEYNKIDDVSNEKILEPLTTINFEFDNYEDNSNKVMSFDDLISKYHIEVEDPIKDIPTDSIAEAVLDTPKDSIAEAVLDTPKDSIAEAVLDTPNETNDETRYNELSETINENSSEYSTENKVEIIEIPDSALDSEQFETREEITNEYGIFEEIVVRKSDRDLEAFDRPLEAVPSSVESSDFEPVIFQNGKSPTEFEQLEKETEEKAQLQETSFAKSNEEDYEAFDGVNETTTEEQIHPQVEIQKPLKRFEAKNSESVIFAPYHVVDYFASQGIKLVLEDQPADNFGKQLKSFTDWLKVMKKIPTRSLIEKADEKEAERIRHFAVHSIEDRDILTESMAEVLAKQGMYENAIALYMKLSLIYPPKSAYFASRIEQLKAALP